MTRVLVPLLAAAFAAGCAGNEVTPDSFARDANAVCREHQAAIDAEPRPGALILFADYTKKVLPQLREQRADVGGLERPAEATDDIDSLLGHWDRVLDAVERIDAAGAAGEDIGIVMGLRSANGSGIDADRIARKLGLGDCLGFNPFRR